MTPTEKRLVRLESRLCRLMQFLNCDPANTTPLPGNTVDLPARKQQALAKIGAHYLTDEAEVGGADAWTDAMDRLVEEYDDLCAQGAADTAALSGD